MGQAKLRSKEISELKSLGKNGKNFGIHLKFHIVDDEQYRYNMLAIYSPEVIEQVRGVAYDEDKCFEIITKHATNLLVVKAGNAQNPTEREREQIQESMRVSALAVLRMAILDPYKESVIGPDRVLEMTLMEDQQGNVGFDLIDGMPGKSLLMMTKGISSYIDNAPDHGVDFITKVA